MALKRIVAKKKPLDSISMTMNENIYDDLHFFEQYSKMNRSQKGLSGAGEWHTFQKMLPDFEGKDVLDLGCGFGWHCRYAVDNGAASVIGVDISERMLTRAKTINGDQKIQYIKNAIDDAQFAPNQFDIVLSSLAFHYLESFEKISQDIYQWLKPGGQLVFSVEHPVFTAFGTQDWVYGNDNDKLYWPVDNYFIEGKREARFLGEKVIKYHRTLNTYINCLLSQGFTVKEVIEPTPNEKMMDEIPEMKDELRRPMMLLIAAEK